MICRKCVKKVISEINNESTVDTNDSASGMEFDDSGIDLAYDAGNLRNVSGNTFGTENLKEDDVIPKSSRDLELEEMLNDLKKKFSVLPNNDPLRVRILTIAPSSWSVRKIVREFGSSRYLAEKSKKLKAKKGVLPETTTKTGNTLPNETVKKII